MLRELIKIANDLDDKGYSVEADYLDGLINKIAQDEDWFDFNQVERENTFRSLKASLTKKVDKKLQELDEQFPDRNKLMLYLYDNPIHIEHQWGSQA